MGEIQAPRNGATRPTIAAVATVNGVSLEAPTGGGGQAEGSGVF